MFVTRGEIMAHSGRQCTGCGPSSGGWPKRQKFASLLQLDEEGSATHKAHFSRIRGHLYGASDDWELAVPIIELSSCLAMGFQFSQTADALINRILQKTAELVSELEGVKPAIH